MPTGTPVNSGDTITAAKMNLKLESLLNGSVNIYTAEPDIETNPTTTSTTFVDMTGLSVTFTSINNSKILVLLIGSFGCNAAAQMYGRVLDSLGNAVIGAGAVTIPASNRDAAVNCAGTATGDGNSRTFKAQFKTDGGTATWYNSKTIEGRGSALIVVEII
jgi:hypothetical protein